jgi:hypothetical protein
MLPLRVYAHSEYEHPISFDFFLDFGSVSILYMQLLNPVASPKQLTRALASAHEHLTQALWRASERSGEKANGTKTVQQH